MNEPSAGYDSAAGFRLPARVDSLAGACEVVLDAIARLPERDEVQATQAALAGRRRDYPVFYLGHLVDPADAANPCPDDLILPDVCMADDTAEGRLARDVIGMLEPLKLLNPISPAFGLGLGPGTLVSSFGIPLDPEASNAPAFNRPLADVLAEPPPDPATSGLLAEMHERIDRIKALTPPRFLIRLPDYQGPFNIVHSIIGSEAFLAPQLDEVNFRALMTRVTDFFIAVRKNLIAWIGHDRLHPLDRLPHISNCSVNLVSPDFYREFILPHDQRVAAEFGELHMNPCSGPHVFRVTYENLPVSVTEAGFIARTAAGAISVDDAQCILADKPVLLLIGQELPPGQEYEFIRHDLDRYAANPRLLFGYTGMHWRRKDRPLIREIHRCLDQHWADQYGTEARQGSLAPVDLTAVVHVAGGRTSR